MSAPAVVQKPPDPLCDLNEGLSKCSVHGDGLSSAQLVTNSSGNQAARIIYGAWGNELYSNDTVPNGLDARFVGGLGVRNDAATGLIYMRHRWYMPEAQRFISRDPLGLGADTNLYRYGANNPTGFTDPLGLLCTARVDEENNVKITIPIAYWSNNLSAAEIEAAAKRFQKTIKLFWEGQKGKYNVTIEIVLYNEQGNEGNENINHIQLGRGKGRSMSAWRLGSNSHLWYAGQPPESQAHEIGHVMGLRDSYEYKGKRLNKPGVPKDDIMGNYYPAMYEGIKPKVYEHHIKGVIDCYGR